MPNIIRSPNFIPNILELRDVTILYLKEKIWREVRISNWLKRGRKKYCYCNTWVMLYPLEFLDH